MYDTYITTDVACNLQYEFYVWYIYITTAVACNLQYEFYVWYI